MANISLFQFIEVKDDEVYEFFQACGKIDNVRIIRDPFTGLAKGFGYVNFFVSIIYFLIFCCTYIVRRTCASSSPNKLNIHV